MGVDKDYQEKAKDEVRAELERVWDLLSRVWLRGGDGVELLAAARTRWRNEGIEALREAAVNSRRLSKWVGARAVVVHEAARLLEKD